MHHCNSATCSERQSTLSKPLKTRRSAQCGSLRSLATPSSPTVDRVELLPRRTKKRLPTIRLQLEECDAAPAKTIEALHTAPNAATTSRLRDFTVAFSLAVSRVQGADTTLETPPPPIVLLHSKAIDAHNPENGHTGTGTGQHCA
ncbi:hypothetical protein SEPCBS119000_003934 [Sporothrix epigloea]|uniref:Uncharacterized protein n=1 Tax=Sporothrix epigloea TaxID=1892477 RepID=A0ABP0DPB5_9PEZI